MKKKRKDMERNHQVKRVVDGGEVDMVREKK